MKKVIMGNMAYGGGAAMAVRSAVAKQTVVDDWELGSGWKAR